MNLLIALCIFLGVSLSVVGTLYVLARGEIREARETAAESISVADAANHAADEAFQKKEEIINLVTQLTTRPAQVIMTPEAIATIAHQIIDHMAQATNGPISLDIIPKEPSK